MSKDRIQASRFLNRCCAPGLIISVLLALLGVAIWWAMHAWTSLGEVEMSVHGYVAMILGIIFSLLVGCGLMALMFYSSRRGYDEPPDMR